MGEGIEFERLCNKVAKSGGLGGWQLEPVG
jgi:hypothetical protein